MKTPASGDPRPTQTPPTRPPRESPGSRTAPAADPDWATAEEIAARVHSHTLSGPAGDSGAAHRDAWLELLSRYTDGDLAMAGKVHDVLSGWHLLGEPWRDELVDEIHVRGTQVTVWGTRGVRQLPGFADLSTARRTIEAITAVREDSFARITHVGGSVVVGRPHRTGPDVASLIADGVMTPELRTKVEQALEDTRTVTVTGPAAPVIVRALTALVPAGSRVFEGPFAVLPPGCVAAASPLDADYVVGVRPGALAENMAATGQIGALVANPETPIQAAVCLTVSGRCAAPGKVTAA